jgi:hypothetical protein
MLDLLPFELSGIPAGKSDFSKTTKVINWGIFQASLPNNLLHLIPGLITAFESSTVINGWKAQVPICAELLYYQCSLLANH